MSDELVLDDAEGRRPVVRLPVTTMKASWNGMIGIVDSDGRIVCHANEWDDARLIVAKLNELYSREDWLFERNTSGTVHEKTAAA